MKARVFLALVGALSLIAVVGTGGASAVQGHQTKYDTITQDCKDSLGNDQGDITYQGPVEVWPPNHKYVHAVITVTDNNANPLNDATASVAGRHDQMVDDTTEWNGAGNTDPATDVVPDAPGAGNPSAVTGVSFRAERSGHKWTDGGDMWRGRTYTFTVMGTVDNGLTECQPVDFTAVVPHDQGNHTGNSTTTTAAAKKKLSSAKARALRARRAR